MLARSKSSTQECTHIGMRKGQRVRQHNSPIGGEECSFCAPSLTGSRYQMNSHCRSLTWRRAGLTQWVRGVPTQTWKRWPGVYIYVKLHSTSGQVEPHTLPELLKAFEVELRGAPQVVTAIQECQVIHQEAFLLQAGYELAILAPSESVEICRVRCSLQGSTGRTDPWPTAWQLTPTSLVCVSAVPLPPQRGVWAVTYGVCLVERSGLASLVGHIVFTSVSLPCSSHCQFFVFRSKVSRLRCLLRTSVGARKKLRVGLGQIRSKITVSQSHETVQKNRRIVAKREFTRHSETCS